MNPQRTVYLALGFFFLALGAIGVVLPVLPTTPFVILAAYCFSHGSETWHRWLLENPVFGPGLRDWENHGVIRKKPKVIATLLIVTSFTSMALFIKAPLWAKLSMITVAILVLVFIWSRPSAPKKNGSGGKTD